MGISKLTARKSSVSFLVSSLGLIDPPIVLSYPPCIFILFAIQIPVYDKYFLWKIEFQWKADEWSTARNNKMRSKLLKVYYAKFKQTRQYNKNLKEKHLFWSQCRLLETCTRSFFMQINFMLGSNRGRTRIKYLQCLWQRLLWDFGLRLSLLVFSSHWTKHTTDLRYVLQDLWDEYRYVGWRPSWPARPGCREAWCRNTKRLIACQLNYDEI